MQSLMSKSEDLLVIGSDEHEWSRGQELFPMTRATAEAIPLEDIEITRLDAFEEGTVGWAVWGERRTYPDGWIEILRKTMVFVLEAGVWKIIHIHLSGPVPNRETDNVAMTRTLAELLESIEEQGDPLKGISGTATLVFTDIVDSTPLSLQLGEERWHAAITAHLDSISDLVEDEGGSVVKTLGDGGMFVFESGAAALRAATRIQQVVSESSEPDLVVRVGVHTGDVVQTEDDYVGTTVAKAARVAAAADGGQILVSTTTAGLVNASEFEFGESITVELKGLNGSHHLQPLNWQ